MKTRKLFASAALTIASVLAPMSLALGSSYTGMFVFGDSLSDPGNNAAALDSMFAPGQPRTPTPVSGNVFVPT
jgi:phospholipase/lecithinase/hemolysin